MIARGADAALFLVIDPWCAASHRCCCCLIFLCLQSIRTPTKLYMLPCWRPDRADYISILENQTSCLRNNPEAILLAGMNLTVTCDVLSLPQQ